jgi:hypothetical protein
LLPLVENQRNAEGRPRQKIISYLGSIREHNLDDIGSRKNFWDKVDSVLTGLEIEESVKEKLRNKLALKVARYTSVNIFHFRKTFFL